MFDRRLLLVPGLLVLAACTSAVQGTGSVSGTPPTSHAPTSGSGPTISGGGTGTLRFPRSPMTTVIGDPPTADLCKAVGLSSFAALGLTPGYADVQFPPGCTIRLSRGSTVALSVNVVGLAPDSQEERPGRTTRTESGLTVYVYRFEASSIGNCQRDIAADGVMLRVIAISRAATGKASEKVDCGATDLMTKAVAAAVAGKFVPRLPQSTPSLSELDFCAVLRRLDLTAVPDLSSGTPEVDGVSAGCQIVSSKVSFYIDFAIGGAGRSKGGETTVGGHVLEAGSSNGSGDCQFTSNQGGLADGREEQVSLSLTELSSGPPADLCDRTARLLATFLDTAGLR